MKTLPSLSVLADDYMFAPLDECRVIPKGEKEVDRLGLIRVYESVMGSSRVRRYVHYDSEHIVACFLVSIKEGCMPVISLTRVRNDKKRQGYGTLLYMDIRSHFPDVQFLHTSPASQAFANAVQHDHVSGGTRQIPPAFIPQLINPLEAASQSELFQEHMKRLKHNQENNPKR